MRGKASPATGVFESPYSTTILPAKDSGRAPKRAAARAANAPAPAAEVAPPAPIAEAPVYIPTHAPVAAPIVAPEPAPVYAPPAQAFAAPATNYPVQYPSAPGFPPQPPYAETAHVADSASWAPPAPSAPAGPPAPVGYPSAPYQPAYQPAAYQPAAFPPPTNPPSGYQPNRFEPQGYAAPGYQAQGYAPPGYPPPGQAQPYQNFPPTSGRSAGSKVLIGLAIGVVGFVVLAILAAIAIPVFLSQRAKTANRNVVLPGILLEQPQVHNTNLDTAMSNAVANLQNSMTGLTETRGAYYGPADQPLFAVVAGRLPNRPTAADENSFFTAIAADDKLTHGFTPTGSGPYGGKMECGQAIAAEAPITFCASVDSAAVVLIIGFSQSSDQTAILARQIIGSIEPARP
jgi:hypothetical protein